MATPQKIIIPPQERRAELPLSKRMNAFEVNEKPTLENITVSLSDLWILVKNWLRSKLFELQASQSVDVGGFKRPRSGGSLQVEGRMKENIGVARYQRDPRHMDRN